MSAQELRTLDAEVAERIFGWVRCTATSLRGLAVLRPRDRVKAEGWALAPGLPLDELRVSALPEYSSSIEDAWKVVEAMRDLGWLFRVETMYSRHERGEVLATFGRFQPYAVDKGRLAPSAPEAICRAALAALEVEP